MHVCQCYLVPLEPLSTLNSHRTIFQVLPSTVHFGYSGHLGPTLSGYYIRLDTLSEYTRIYVFCTRKSGHYPRMATMKLATVSGEHCISETREVGDHGGY